MQRSIKILKVMKKIFPLIIELNIKHNNQPDKARIAVVSLVIFLCPFITMKSSSDTHVLGS